MTTVRTTMLETVDGEQFHSRYHLHNSSFYRMSEKVIISIKNGRQGIDVFVKSNDGIYDFVGDVSFDKSDSLKETANVLFHSKGINGFRYDGDTIIDIELDAKKAREYKEKSFFDLDF
ncbi:hypothetical protein [Caryophanon latum]|uniref:Uncharacterized protein n=1 Tax=Caryophanon latum TaxID=33977 RepID=A0A1C0YX50_9BACL|nr:hypothetical protein [Caryophanon latum]OCS91762.1 hypothetical protein A6K76_01215 [Caryophanon latum]